MSTPQLLLSLLCFPSMIAANALLMWAFHKTKRAGIWPTEKFFGMTIRRQFHPADHLHVIEELRRRMANAKDPGEARRYRHWLYALYAGYGLGLFGLAVFLVLAPWMLSQKLQP